MRSLLLASVLGVVAAQGWIIGRYSASPSTTATAATAVIDQDTPPLMALTADGKEFAIAAYHADPSNAGTWEDAWFSEAHRLAVQLGQPVAVTQGGSLVCIVRPEPNAQTFIHGHTRPNRD